MGFPKVSASIGIIGAASPLFQETFSGALFHDPSVGFSQCSHAQKKLAAAIGGGFVGLLSLFNIGGRFFWATFSDSIGRKTTYFVFFLLGVFCYSAASTLGFARVPAYLVDIFGTRYVGAIHGRLLTAWSTAGIIGPVIVNYLHYTQMAEGVPHEQIYGVIFYVLAALLAAGFICNTLIWPVKAKWHMAEEKGKKPAGTPRSLERSAPAKLAGAVSC